MCDDCVDCKCKDEALAEELEVVWRDPTGYDPVKHGPPYLPIAAKAASSRLKQASGEDFVKELLSAFPHIPESPYSAVFLTLALQRALVLVHQTAHWQTRGGNYYADHLLFERLYSEADGAVDGLAERLIGLTGDPSFVSLKQQLYHIQGIVDVLVGEGVPKPEELVEISLRGEKAAVAMLPIVIQGLKEDGCLTDGLEDLLQGLASKHEEAVYLLQQRQFKVAYDYAR
jgi:DNA-binding ferritin-like protein